MTNDESHGKAAPENSSFVIRHSSFVIAAQVAGFYLHAMPHRSWFRPCLLGGNLAAPAALLATRFEWPWLFGAAALIHGGFACAVMRPQCVWFGPVATRFATEAREVWLTIDDGPAGDDSRRLGDELAARGVCATFFVIGQNLARFPEAARQWIAAGHTLANHTNSHPSHSFPWLPSTQLRREIDDCAVALAAAGVAERRWFRAPVGLKSVRLHPALAARGLRLIAWNVRGCDGVAAEPAAVVRRVVAGARPGAIVLLHEGRPRSVATILQVVDALRERGFTFTIPPDADLR